MKMFLLILSAAGLTLTLAAQTNAPEPAAVTASAEAVESLATNSPATNAPLHERLKTEIFSESARFDGNKRVVTYLGNVQVKDPQLTLTCDLLTASVPESGRIDSVVAEQNVVIDGLDKEGRPLHAICDKAVYTYQVVNARTNETIELTGNPQVTSQMFNGTGDPIVWDRVSNTIKATHVHTVFEQDAKNRTNAAPAAVGKK